MMRGKGKSVRIKREFEDTARPISFIIFKWNNQKFYP